MKDIRLVNHSCFSFVFDGKGCLVDPWFEGSIFNDSWRLVSDGGIIPSNLKYIFISHEHPDHLNWTTLKRLSDSDITVVLCERNNSNVESNLLRLGYKVLTVPEKNVKNIEGLSVEFVRNGHDHTIIFKHEGLVMVNQNDCHLTDNQVNYINSSYGTIDIWWMQFSLAGYYGNLNNPQLLLEANKKHRKMFYDYRKLFNPKIAIPFASFIYFCRDENKGLNAYRVKLQDICEDNENTQILYKDDLVLLDSSFKDRNLNNIAKWEKHFDSDLEMEKPEATEIDLINSFTSFCDKYNPQGAIGFETFDGVGCLLNFTEKSCFFEHVKNPIAKVTLYDLSQMFKNPWGADTMNITSCFHVYDKESWSRLLLGVDALYHR